MDMGIIHSIKSNYRLKLAQKLLALLDSKSNPTAKDIDLYDALIMLKDSWDEVSIETIKNCFVKSGLKFTNTDLEIDQNESESYDYILNELSERIGLENLNFEDYVNFDNNISVFNENIDKIYCSNSLRKWV
jgi:hypothetical protein